jgi:hypothetical protein
MIGHRVKFLVAFLFLVSLIYVPAVQIKAQTNDTDLVASLVRGLGVVEVKRVNTANWVAIGRETLVGVGDSIRTGVGANAQITFFSNGTVTDIEPSTEFRIDTFSGSESQYQLAVTVVVGQTTQRVFKLLDSNSSYTINSTGLELAVRGTELAVRVEPSGRSAMIVQTGAVKTMNTGGASSAAPAEVDAGFGVRAEHGKGLSDVVPANSFAALDTALDGCPTTLQFKDDVALNVRLGPNKSFPRVGRLDANATITLIGVTDTTHWYRTPFKGGYAWFTYSALTTGSDCALLRKFADNYGPEDASKYQNLDSDITLSPVATAEPTATK